MIIKKIAELIEGRALLSTAPGAPLADACRIMAGKNVGALAVIDAARLTGILSERDVIRRCIAAGRKVSETTVQEVMTADPVTIGPEDSLAEAQSRMIAGGFRHLPVLSNEGRPAGMVSMRDIPTEYRLMMERFRECFAPLPTA